MITRGILASLLLIALAADPTQAQEGAAAEPAADLAPAVTAIPLAEIESRAARATEEIRSTNLTLTPHPEAESIEAGLAEQTEAIGKLLLATRAALEGQPTTSVLQRLSDRWKTIAASLSVSNAALAARIEEIDDVREELGTLDEAWQLTRHVAREQGAPAGVVRRIGRTLAEIEKAGTSAKQRRGAVLTLQSGIGEQIDRVAEARVQLEAALEELRGRLFERDRPEFWSSAFRAQLRADLDHGIWDNLAEDLEDLSSFVVRRGDRIVVQVLLLIAVIIGLRNARSAARQRVEEEPALARAEMIFEHPISAALLVGLFTSLLLYPQAPSVVTRLLGIATVFPAAILLRVFLPRPLLPLIYGMVIFVVTFRLQEFARGLTTVSRLALLVEVSTGTVILLYMLRPARLVELPRGLAGSAGFHLVGSIMRATLAGFAFSLLACVAGYVQLAALLGVGLSRSATGALALYAAVSVLHSLLLFGVRSPWLRWLGMVRRHRARFEQGGLRVLATLAVIWWTHFTLQQFSLLAPLVDGVTAILTASLTIGDLSLSLGDFVAFGLVVWISMWLARALRFILEEDVYPRVRLARGMPYAVSTMVRYAVISLGFLAAVSATGLSLDRFAILLGALGVGIGFGLQNVVNNFVSGLILLFERPVQVGDVVELPNLHGRIERIGIRASIVRTWDGAEVVVPNGNLVSDPLTNWTLSDRRRRLEIELGVAYGTDPERVIDLITEVAKAHPDILADPVPTVLFLDFGDSSLDFSLRAWTGQYDEGLRIRSDLAVAINRSLAEAGIEIPFPQRDLHLRSVAPELRAGGDGDRAPAKPPQS